MDEKAYEEIDFNQVDHDIQESSRIGLWVVDTIKGKPKRLYCNDNMCRLMEIDPNLSPEETFAYWQERSYNETYELIDRAVAKMEDGFGTEEQYYWEHPSLGKVKVRIGGHRNMSVKSCIRVEGYCQMNPYDDNDMHEAFLQKQLALQESIKALKKTISERDRAMKKKNELKDEMTAIHASLGSSSWSINYDLKGKIESCDWGATTRKMIGYSSIKSFPNEVSSWDNVIHEGDFLRVAKSYKETLKDETGKTNFDVECRLLTQRQGYHWFRATGRLTRREDGSPEVLQGVLLDIDQEKQMSLELEKALEVAERSNKAKTTFLSSMSHDIRTPMNAILGFARLAEEHIDRPEDLKNDLAKIQVSGDYLLSLINDVLDMSRIENGKVKLQESELSLRKLLRDLSTIMRPEAEQKKIEFHTSMSGVQNDRIYGDKLRLDQILLNLTGNAIKFTKAGGSVRVRIQQMPCDQEGYGNYELHVKDTGIGISQEFQKQIFEPFTRELTSTITGIKGTGLGMAITKNIVDLMGGTIEVESHLGKGSEFIVRATFRLAEESEEAAEVETESTKKKEKKLAPIDFVGKRILLVEDNELNQEIALAILKDLGFITDLATDGSAAVRKMKSAKANSYDLILMDIQMPRMNGYAATKAIRRLDNKKVAKIPIFAMTANAFEEDKQKAMEAGMDGHIAKPIRVPELVETIATVFK